MTIHRSPATAAFLAILMCLARAASANPLCVVPTSVPVDILPTGCEAVLTNGPVTFTSVVDANGHIHNVSTTSMILSNMDLVGLSLTAEFVGTDHDLTGGTTTPFDVTVTDFFQTTPTDNHYPADTGTHTFDIAHFINTLAPGVGLKLNFGESGRPAQNSFVTSVADTTSHPGNFTISSTFDIYTELTLDGTVHWTVADNDFLPGSDIQGPGSVLQLQNISAVPEPGTLTLAALGLTTALARRRRRQ